MGEILVHFIRNRLELCIEIIDKLVELLTQLFVEVCPVAPAMVIRVMARLPEVECRDYQTPKSAVSIHVTPFPGELTFATGCLVVEESWVASLDNLELIAPGLCNNLTQGIAHVIVEVVAIHNIIGPIDLFKAISSHSQANAQYTGCKNVVKANIVASYGYGRSICFGRLGPFVYLAFIAALEDLRCNSSRTR